MLKFHLCRVELYAVKQKEIKIYQIYVRVQFNHINVSFELLIVEQCTI